MIRYEVIRTSPTLSTRPTPGFNLLYQMQRNPCLELQYQGGQLAGATHFRLYGTCNFQRMFRFTARLSRKYACWRLDMAVWNRTAARYDHRRSLTELYELRFGYLRESAVVLQKIGNSSRHVIIGRRDVEQLNGDELRMRFRAFELDINGTNIPSCQCSNRSLIEAWSARRGDDQDRMGYRHFVIELAAVVTGLVALGFGAYRAWFTRVDRFSVTVVQEMVTSRRGRCSDGQSTGKLRKAKNTIRPGL